MSVKQGEGSADAGAATDVMPEARPPRGTRSCALLPLGCSRGALEGAAAELEVLSIQCRLLAPSGSIGCDVITYWMPGVGLLCCAELFPSICDLRVRAQKPACAQPGFPWRWLLARSILYGFCTVDVTNMAVTL